MRVESMSSRLDFDERRARALEGVVQYRPRRRPAQPPPAPVASAAHCGDGAERGRRSENAADPAPRPQASRRRRARPAEGGPQGRRRRSPPPGGRGAADASRCGARSDGGDAGATAPRDRHGDADPRRSLDPIVKLAVVVQRYGADINGGAELHARYIAERLARHARGRGRDHLRARLRHLEERAAGRRRDRSTASPCAGFRSTTSASPLDFGRHSQRVFERRTPSPTSCLARQRGPGQPGDDRLPRRGRRSTTSCSSAIATTTRGTARAPLADKAVLVPTAERDPAIALEIFGPVFRGVRASCTTRTKSAR